MQCWQHCFSYVMDDNIVSARGDTTARTNIKIGIIGGSGLDDPDIIDNRTEKTVTTPYGQPSDVLIIGTIADVPCVLLARHGRSHSVMPTNINFRANVYSLKREGCSHIVVTTACGSLQEPIQPGEIVFPDQFIDRTTKRESTFYDGLHSEMPGVCHIPMAYPFCADTRQLLIETARELDIKCHMTGTAITVEGPRFSSRAESMLFRSWGADIINMTTVPEVVLANELGLCYAAIAMATDYDCWKDDHQHVSTDYVLQIFKENSGKAKNILRHVIPKIAAKDWTKILKQKQDTIKSSFI